MTIEELREEIHATKEKAKVRYFGAERLTRTEAEQQGKVIAYEDCLNLLDQYIAANKDKEQDHIAGVSNEIKSNCCGQRAFVVGDVTKHYECEKCGNACDLQYYYHIADANKKVERCDGGYNQNNDLTIRLNVNKNAENIKQLTERVEQLEQLDEDQDSINELLTNRVELIEQWDEQHDFVNEQLINRVEKLEQRINKWDIL